MVESLESLMQELDGADPETVHRLARDKGSLAVRLAMLGLASARKSQHPLWWGYPPGVFIGYKWEDASIHDLTLELAGHVRRLGYKAFLDVENLDDSADNYFQIPQFITTLQDCIFYILLLTERAADMIDARTGYTTWIFDEYQHAVRLANGGRLIIIPMLLERRGTTHEFTLENVVDLTGDPLAFGVLDDLLPRQPAVLTADDVAGLAAAVTEFDRRFLQEDWASAAAILHESRQFAQTFDHEFRKMLLSIYTADEAGLGIALGALRSRYGEQIVWHIYRGYCAEHAIPDRSSHT